MYTAAVMKFADVQFLSHARETSDYAKKCGGYFLFIITKPMRPRICAPYARGWLWFEIIKGLVFFEAFAN